MSNILTNNTRCERAGGVALSVIIPARNRRSRLLRTLESLQSQTTPASEYEVIVIDDSCPESTLSGCELPPLPNLHYFSMKAPRPEYSRRHLCRNEGVLRAQGEVLLFWAEDMIARSDLIERHLRWHKRDQELVILGYRIHVCVDHLLWHSLGKPLDVVNVDACVASAYRDDERTSILRARCGGKFDRLPNPWRFGFTCNMSASRALINMIGPCDSRFRGWGVSDQEFAYRMWRTGAQFRFDVSAIGYHQVHRVSEKQRDEWLANLSILREIHPELSDFVAEEFDRYESVIKRERYPQFIREVQELAIRLGGTLDLSNRWITLTDESAERDIVHKALASWLYALEDDGFYLLCSPETPGINSLGFRIQA